MSSSTGNPQVGNLADALRELVGQPLSSVEFVQDYVQLHFDGPTLTAYTRPTISVRSSTLAWCDSGYRDALCEQIGSVVHRVKVQPEEVSLLFESGSGIEVSLRPDDYRGPEALQFWLKAGRTWVA